jgi:hypothetical protein
VRQEGEVKQEALAAVGAGVGGRAWREKTSLVFTILIASSFLYICILKKF